MLVNLTNLYTAISRKVVGKSVHAAIPKGNMGYDQYTVPDDCSCRTYFCCFPLALANICPWPPVPFFQISLKNRALKTTHNTFRDCRVHFFRQPFSKQQYTDHLLISATTVLLFDWKRKNFNLIVLFIFSLYSFFFRITGERDKEVVFRDSASS